MFSRSKHLPLYISLSLIQTVSMTPDWEDFTYTATSVSTVRVLFLYHTGKYLCVDM